MRLRYIILVTLLIVLITGCTPEERFQKQLDREMAKEITYRTYRNNDFSVMYPEWPETDKAGKGAEVSVSKGYCTVMVNTEQIPAENWYDAMIDSINNQDAEIIIEDKENLHVKHSAKHLNFTMMSDTRMYSCNGFTHAVIVVCIAQADEKVQHIHGKVFNSAMCNERIEIKEEPEVKEKITYNTLKEGDFLVEHPDWVELEDESGEERVLGVTKGVCSLLVNKHNALPKDIVNWMENALSGKDDHTLLESSGSGNEYYIEYEMPYQEHRVTAQTKIIYCNYITYLTQVLCVNELITEEFEEMRDRVMKNAACLKKYEVPTPVKVEKKKEEVKEKEPEVIEEIEDDIVKTNAGEEFGIDEEMVVYFINNNAFFRKIMKDFSKGNLVIEDEDRELKLRVLIDENGKITLLEDGQHDDADVTLIVPLRDALNIFSNAQNINPGTLLAFAVNVRTVPSNVKTEVIQKVLRGEYN